MVIGNADDKMVMMTLMEGGFNTFYVKQEKGEAESAGCHPLKPLKPFFKENFSLKRKEKKLQMFKNPWNMLIQHCWTPSIHMWKLETFEWFYSSPEIDIDWIAMSTTLGARLYSGWALADRGWPLGLYGFHSIENIEDHFMKLVNNIIRTHLKKN